MANYLVHSINELNDNQYNYFSINNNELYHHGILGQKWGVRRYQNEDGTLTDLGRKRYLNSNGSLNDKGKKFNQKHKIVSKEYTEKLNNLTVAEKNIYDNIKHHKDDTDVLEYKTKNGFELTKLGEGTDADKLDFAKQIRRFENTINKENYKTDIESKVLNTLYSDAVKYGNVPGNYSIKDLKSNLNLYAIYTYNTPKGEDVYQFSYEHPKIFGDHSLDFDVYIDKKKKINVGGYSMNG